MLSAAFASLMALKNGYTTAALADAAIGGVTTAVGAIFILLAVGALIGTWNMAGTIPTVVDYGVQLLHPSIFFLATAAICAIVGMVTGSSWTTAGTLGVAFVGMAGVMGVSQGHGGRRGHLRRLLRRQDDPALGDHDPRPAARRRRLTTGQHIRNMFWTAGPALGISLVAFLFIGLSRAPERLYRHPEGGRRARERVPHLAGQPAAARAAGGVHGSRRSRPSSRSWVRRCSPAILACFTQWTAVKAFVDDDSLGTLATGVKAVYGAMATGFVSHSGVSADRRPVLPRRHGGPADHRVAGAGGDGVRGHPRARRVPQPAVAPGRRRGPAPGAS